MIGIYKIISPKNRIYIGQSIDIEKRFNTYKLLHCKKQIRLYNSFLKYGIDKHKFEILCECSVEELNEKERYYQDTFSILNKNGLNCKLTKTNDRNGKHSEETKLKIIESRKGYTHSEETKNKLSNAQKGKKLSKEIREKMSIARKGKKHSIEHCNKIIKSLKGNTNSLGSKHSKESREKRSEIFKKIILNTQTGIFYLGAEEASITININKGTLIGYLNGRYKNKTPFIYI